MLQLIRRLFGQKAAISPETQSPPLREQNEPAANMVKVRPDTETINVGVHQVVRPTQDHDRMTAEAAAYVAIPLQHRMNLRRLDVGLAVEFMLYTSVDDGPLQLVFEPRGIRKFRYDELPSHTQLAKRDLESIPFYSTDERSFHLLRQVVKSDCENEYVALLIEQSLTEESASLEQKCRVALLACYRKKGAAH